MYRKQEKEQAIDYKLIDTGECKYFVYSNNMQHLHLLWAINLFCIEKQDWSVLMHQRR